MRILRARLIMVATMLSMPIVAHAFSDPTQPMDFVAGPTRAISAAPAGPVLQSTQVSAAHKAAIISGKRVRVGDTYEGARIVAITQNEVRLVEKGGRETVLRVFPRLTKEQGAVQ